MMTDHEVFSNLCAYDTRNPNYVNQDWTDEKIKPAEKDCYCDNCFRGRNKLALEIIALKTSGAANNNTQQDVSEVPPVVRLRVNAAARECWLALRDLTDYYLHDCGQIPDADFNLFSAATAHPGVQKQE